MQHKKINGKLVNAPCWRCSAAAHALVVFVGKHKKAAVGVCHQRAQSCVDGVVAVLDLFEHDAQDDDVVDGGMLQQVNLQHMVGVEVVAAVCGCRPAGGRRWCQQ